MNLNWSLEKYRRIKLCDHLRGFLMNAYPSLTFFVNDWEALTENHEPENDERWMTIAVFTSSKRSLLYLDYSKEEMTEWDDWEVLTKAVIAINDVVSRQVRSML